MILMKNRIYRAFQGQKAVNQSKAHSQYSPKQVHRWYKLENSVEKRLQTNSL